MSGTGTGNGGIVPTGPGAQSLLRSVVLLVSGGLTMMIVTWLNSRGFATTDMTFLGYTVSPTLLIGTAVFTTISGIAAAIWGYLKGTKIGQLLDHQQMVGVQAGMNLAASGNMIMVQKPDGATVPLPVTSDSAKEIVKTYAPTPPDADPVVVTQGLNLESLKESKQP